MIDPRGEQAINPTIKPDHAAVAAPSNFGSIPPISLRWVTETGVQQLAVPLTGDGPAVIAAGQHGATLAAALLEALDLATERTQRRVQVGRDGLQLFLELPAELQWPDESPTLILGGDEAGRSIGFPARTLGRERFTARIATLIGADGVGVIRHYPHDCRALAAAHRRAEEELMRCDTHLDARRRASRWLSAVAAFGLVAAFFATPNEWHWLLVLSAGCFTGGVAGLAVERMGHGARRRQRDKIEGRLSHFGRKAAEVERVARQLARQAGYSDPWDLATRLEQGPMAQGIGAHTGEVLAIARQLASQLGIDTSSLERPEAWNTGELAPGGWPAEVRTREGEFAEPRTLVAMARLIDRARALPGGWPLLVWQPWAVAPSPIRAAYLMALARHASRPVIALLSQ